MQPDPKQTDERDRPLCEVGKCREVAIHVTHQGYFCDHHYWHQSSDHYQGFMGYG